MKLERRTEATALALLRMVNGYQIILGVLLWYMSLLRYNPTPPDLLTRLSYQQLDSLHALRGFCAFYVVVFHAKFVLWSGGSAYLAAFPRASWSVVQYLGFAADLLCGAGMEMVVFFFVLSGFFIRYAQSKKHRAAGQFYLNRAVRIFPPYLVSLGLSSAVLAYLATRHASLLAPAIPARELNTGLAEAWRQLRHLTPAGVGRALLFLRSEGHFWGYNGVYWSLFPEALFYVLVPFAFRQARLYYTVSATLYLMGLLGANLPLHLDALSEFLFQYNAYFALGMALYDVVTARPGWLQAFRRVCGYTLAVGGLVLWSLLFVLAALGLKTVSAPLAAVLAVASVSVLLAGRVGAQHWPVRFFHHIGPYSFSLYLYHFPLLLLCYPVVVAITGAPVAYTRYYWLAVPVVTAGCYALYLVTERLAIRYFRGI